jgi:2-keto-4-pentenoate hydratase/2-oxohepta-3-ene-1,7-dioic acid hydratase in catechol pathway
VRVRFARLGDDGSEIPVVAGEDGRWRDLRPLTADIDGAFLGGDLDHVRRALAADALTPVGDGARFGPPLSGIGKIICVGLNYRLHAAETGAAIPEEPVLFMKAPDTVVGAYDDVLIPRGSTKTDWEVELAVVVGREVRYLDSPAAAPQSIAGYAISHDVSERDFQLNRGGQWDKGKNCETFNPFGPWIATPDEVPDPQDLGISLAVNGKPRQTANTADMVFDICHLVWYISQFMRLLPGDVINTGTPAGVALGSPEQRYLNEGDVVELRIDHLGVQRQRLRKA